MFKSVLKVITIFIALGLYGQGQCSIDQDQVKKIQDYLTGIKTLKANLLQYNADGSQQTGEFSLLREFKRTSYGKLRIEYKAPINDLIVVDGEHLIYFDSRAREKNSYTVDATPAAFLLTPKISFSGDLKVKDLKKEDGRLVLKVVRRGDESGGILVLKFNTEPMLKLTGWEVTDPQGNLTKVDLENVVIGIDLDPGLFKDK